MARVIAYFGDEAALLRATRALRAAGIAIEDAYTPYAVHGLDEAMGLPRSRLTWVCFAAGVFGASCALGFQLWTSVVSWPLNVGGKPFASVPAFIPVTFEFTVLCAALVSVAAFFIRSRLYPGRAAAPLPRVTDDRFALVLSEGATARRLLGSSGASEISPEGSLS
jgi:Protein of unknown function (DUF3341)